MSIFKNKWFGRTLMLVLACFMFLSLKDRVAAKADDPEASARIIYAKDILDNDNKPTGSFEYSFDNVDEAWFPYAVYVTTTAASGSAITLDNSLLEGDYRNIRIWDNNCGISINANYDYVNKNLLILVGPGSYLDAGWSHLNRGGLPAESNTSYPGPDNDATLIADYFNAFVFDNDTAPNFYFNDESVTMGFIENEKITTSDDPHYGKTVHNINWVMQVTNLTLEPNVVAFIQDGGFIEVSGELIVNPGSYIEGIDDNPKLGLLDDNAHIEGMTLYDDSGATLNSGFAGQYRNIDQAINGVLSRIWAKLPNNLGSPEVKTAAKKNIYAYNTLDFDGDGDSEDNDLTFALASELLVRFRDAFGPFGMFGNYSGDREEVWDKVFNDALAFRDRISIDFDHPETITAERADGTTESIPRYTATVDWGQSITCEPIVDTVYVYRLPRMDDLLICTDFNETLGYGTKYYLRRSFDDKKVLVGNVNASFNNVDEDYFTSVIVDDSYTNIVAGGHGVKMYEKNKDRNLFTFQTVSYSYMKFYDMDHDRWEIINQDTFVKVFRSTGKFFATASRGEAKRYDFVSHDATGNAADKIWEADGQYPVKLFIHDTVLHIMPLNANSGVSRALDTVRITDSLPAGAVTINDDDESDIVITFNSNFYDTVNFELVYDDGSTGAFTVEREGIIIQYTGLDYSGNGRYWLDIYGEGAGNELNYTYNKDTENFVVMATYYHSSAETGVNNLKLVVTYDDGTTKVIDSNDTDHNFSGYKSGAAYVVDGRAAVDTTTFIIGFMKAEGNGFTFSSNGHIGGFCVQVVKSGYDNADSFGGALAGSGKGKEWNGHVIITH